MPFLPGARKHSIPIGLFSSIFHLTSSYLVETQVGRRTKYFDASTVTTTEPILVDLPTWKSVIYTVQEVLRQSDAKLSTEYLERELEDGEWSNWSAD